LIQLDLSNAIDLVSLGWLHMRENSHGIQPLYGNFRNQDGPEYGNFLVSALPVPMLNRYCLESPKQLMKMEDGTVIGYGQGNEV